MLPLGGRHLQVSLKIKLVLFLRSSRIILSAEGPIYQDGAVIVRTMQAADTRISIHSFDVTFTYKR